MHRRVTIILAAFLILNGFRTVVASGPSPSEGDAAFSQANEPGLESSVLAATSFSWFDITGIGTPLRLSDWGTNDDEDHASVPLPWPFPWFGSSYTTLYLDPNGNVGFEDWPVDTWVGDGRIPSQNPPNNRIAIFYEDMAGRDTGACGGTEGGVYTYYDLAANRFVVQYDHWCSWEGYQLNTFEVILYPNGQVQVQYLEVPSSPTSLPFGNPAGETAVGIESPDGSGGLALRSPVLNSTAWLYRPPELSGANRLYLPLIP